jgi:hypothetical protein
VPVASAPTSARKPISSSRIPKVSGGSSPRLPAQAPPRPPNRLPPILAAAGGLVLALAAALSGSPSRRPDPPAPGPTAVWPPDPPPDLEPRVRDLESTVASAPDAGPYLAACDELRPKVRGTPLERRVAALEESARARHRLVMQAGQGIKGLKVWR